MYKALVHLGFVLLYALVVFFGLGPVLLADGPHTERVMTFIVVLIAAAALAASHVWLTRRLR